MKKTLNGKTASGVAVLVIFCVFAACALGVLLTGAKSYRSITKRDAEVYNIRTCVQYVGTKLRQVSAPEKIAVTEFGGGDALCLREEINGEVYLTRIYCHEGWLKELFTAEDAGLTAEDGEKILPLENFSVEKKGTLVTASFTDENGNEAELVRSVRGLKGAVS